MLFLDVAVEVNVLTVGDVYDSLLPGSGLTTEETALGPARLVLGTDIDSVDASNFHAVEVLDECLDLILVSLGRNHEGVAVELVSQLARLLGNDGFD